MRILLDNSILSDGTTGQGSLEDIGMDNMLVLAKGRPEPDVTKKAQIECLPTIARLARQAEISLYTYHELVLEGMARGESRPGALFGDLFAKVEISRVPSAVRRGIFFQSDFTTQNQDFEGFL